MAPISLNNWTVIWAPIITAAIVTYAAPPRNCFTAKFVNSTVVGCLTTLFGFLCLAGKDFDEQVVFFTNFTMDIRHILVIHIMIGLGLIFVFQVLNDHVNPQQGFGRKIPYMLVFLFDLAVTLHAALLPGIIKLY